MTILLDERNKVVVQGITGHQGQFHTGAMLEFGTNVVAGVTPGKAGQTVHGVEVFESMKDAARDTGADTSILFVPARFVKSATREAIDSGMQLIVIISEHVPVHDSIEIIQMAKAHGIRIVGPNCPGIGSPGKAKLGIMPNHIFKEGKVGLVSRSGTLTYEVVNALTESGIGQSTCVGIGGDPIVGTSFIDVLDLFQNDPDTSAIVLIGEIGGTAEEEAADFIMENVTKPVCTYVAGLTAPPGKRMGHAGAIISRGRGTAESKVRALKEAGVKVAAVPHEIPNLVWEVLNDA
ncbi:MAG TPA: succinate--CoA ligase subunit alpha [Methanomassiliicoccales archaeon]|nr:succinate--CoA ligase subunit alpha [Methanomassiliicoccales archaeon]